MKKTEAHILLERIARNRDILDTHLKVGDVLTHKTMLGCLEEHTFTERDDIWLVGVPTEDTRKFTGQAEGAEKRISPLNITHINRAPIERYPTAAKIRDLIRDDCDDEC